MKVARVAILLGGTLGAVAAWEAAGDRSRAAQLERELAEFQQSERSARLTYVTAVYEMDAQRARLRLKIESARAIAGSPPFLVDDGQFQGRVELVDRDGKVVWSMGYVPGTLDQNAQRRPGEPLGRLRLRLPFRPGSAGVRLYEPARGLRAEAPIR